MKKYTVRAFCILVVPVFLLFFSLPAGSAAREDPKQACGEHLTWSLDDEGLLTIRGTGEMYSYTDYGPWNHHKVKSVVLEDGVGSIGARAFSDCYFLKSIEIPASVAAIGDYAFFRCYKLKTITLPDDVREIGENPFAYCAALEEIILSPDHPVLSFGDGMLSSIPDHRLVCHLHSGSLDDCVIPEGTTIIGDYAFAECEDLHFLTIPEGVSVIGSHAFSGCTGLVVRDYPQSLVSVGDYAFHDCRYLGHVRFKEGLTSIGEGAFAYCWYIQNIDLPDSLTTLGSHPFDDCRCLDTFNMSENHPLLGFTDGILYSKPDGKMIFYAANNPADTFAVPEGIEIIGERAFANAGELRTIILPESVREIEKQGFWHCDNVEEIVFSQGLETIGEWAFYEMNDLKEALLPDGVKSIGDEAFLNCSNLEAVRIPGSVESIGKDLFINTDMLNLVVYVDEGSAAETYCQANHLLAVYPGEAIPEPETDLPAVFSQQYPEYKGIAELYNHETDAVYLAGKPDGTLVLLCGTDHHEAGWTVTESAPLPDEARVVLDDGLVLLDTGRVKCTVTCYYGDIWGIEYTGWRDLFFGPGWIGYRYPRMILRCVHPWTDLTTINWETLPDNLTDAMRYLDVSSIAATRQDNPDGRALLYAAPDPEGTVLAELLGDVPLTVEEKDTEWTRVSIGRDDGIQWKLEGWIRTEDLIFREKANKDQLFRMEYFLTAAGDLPLTLITPIGNEELYVDDLSDTWYVIGEKTIDGEPYWLMYECYTEQVGFILKEDVSEPNG